MRKTKTRKPKPPDRGIGAQFTRSRRADAIAAGLGDGLKILATAVNTDLPDSFRICGASEGFELLADDGAPAADGKPKLKRFSMVAYTGGAMRLRGFPSPVVVDLAGMAQPSAAGPIYKSHDPDKIVAHWDKVELSAQRIKVGGLMSGVGEDAQEVRDLAGNGFPWQASIGADAQRIEYVDRDEKVTVNGRSFTGPLYVARATTLGEVSFVPRGADSSTSASVAAAASQVDTMKFEQWLVARGFTNLTDAERKLLKAAFDAEQKFPTPPVVTPPVQANPAPAPVVTPPLPSPIQAMEAEIAARRVVEANEINRINGIRRLCAAQPGLEMEVAGLLDASGKPRRVNVQAHATAEGWTCDQTELAVLRAGRPAGPFAYAVAGSDNVDNTILAAAVFQACRKFDAHADEPLVYTDRVMQAAQTRFKGRIGLQQLLTAAAALHGYRGDSSIRGDGDLERVLYYIKASKEHDLQADGASSGSISNLLSNVQNKYLLVGYRNVEGGWRRIAAMRQVKDFKPTKSVALLGDFVFQAVGPDGELKHATIGDQAFANQAATYGRFHVLTRADMINDDLSALTEVPTKLGRGAALKLNNVFWTEFMNPSGNADDAIAFYATSHTNANYFTGSTTNLSSASLKTALINFRNQVDPNGQPLGAIPAILLTGPTLEVDALELLKAIQLVGTGQTANTRQPNINVWSGRYEPVVSSYLENASFTNYSTTAWYLLADPADVPVVEACFLNGIEEPTVQTATPDFDTLGIAMRGFMDFGIKMQNFRGVQKSKGAA